MQFYYKEDSYVIPNARETLCRLFLEWVGKTKHNNFTVAQIQHLSIGDGKSQLKGEEVRASTFYGTRSLTFIKNDADGRTWEIAMQVITNDDDNKAAIKIEGNVYFEGKTVTLGEPGLHKYIAKQLAILHVNKGR